MNLTVTFNFPDGTEVNDLEARCDTIADIADAIAGLVMKNDLGDYSSLVITAVPDAE